MLKFVICNEIDLPDLVVCAKHLLITVNNMSPPDDDISMYHYESDHDCMDFIRVDADNDTNILEDETEIVELKKFDEEAAKKIWDTAFKFIENRTKPLNELLIICCCDDQDSFSKSSAIAAALANIFCSDKNGDGDLFIWVSTRYQVDVDIYNVMGSVYSDYPLAYDVINDKIVNIEEKEEENVKIELQSI